jgi:hypothetical protein
MAPHNRRERHNVRTCCFCFCLLLEGSFLCFLFPLSFPFLSLYWMGLIFQRNFFVRGVNDE